MTATNRISLDTNILIYSADRTDKKRQEIALEVLDKAIQADCVLTLQSLAEFYFSATRKKILPVKAATEVVHDWQITFPITIAKTTTITKAIYITHNHQLAFWDSMLLATAQEAGVNLLLSEDFNHHQIIDGIRIVNPFKSSEFWQI